MTRGCGRREEGLQCRYADPASCRPLEHLVQPNLQERAPTQPGAAKRSSLTASGPFGFLFQETVQFQISWRRKARALARISTCAHRLPMRQTCIVAFLPEPASTAEAMAVFLAESRRAGLPGAGQRAAHGKTPSHGRAKHLDNDSARRRRCCSSEESHGHWAEGHAAASGFWHLQPPCAK